MSSEEQEPIGFNNLPELLYLLYHELQSSIGPGYHLALAAEGEDPVEWNHLQDQVDDVIQSLQYALSQNQTVAHKRLLFQQAMMFRAMGIQADIRPVVQEDGTEFIALVVPKTIRSLSQQIDDLHLNLTPSV